MRAIYILETRSLFIFVSRSDATSNYVVLSYGSWAPSAARLLHALHSFSVYNTLSVCSANVGASTVCPSMLRALTLLACSLATGVAEITQVGGCEVVGFCVRSPDYGLLYARTAQAQLRHWLRHKNS